MKIINRFKKSNKNQIKDFWVCIPKHRYNSYGKVKYINPKGLLKKAFIFDTLVPLTFFIPVILAFIVYIFTLGKEFKITLKND